MNNIYEIAIVGLLMIALTFLGIVAGYKIRGVEDRINCSRDNVVVIHAK